MAARDPFQVDGHTARSALLAEKLARELGLPEGFVINVRDAASLHDIGKMSIAESILNKVKLTESERHMIQSHADIGYQVISALHFDKSIADAILHHHENWNGTGYPDKLAREAIPLESRIIRVVDCFDAMTHKRSYREVYTVERAIMEMEKEIGISFDPTIFNVFRRITLGI
jgi:putative nucleotidyltransferase with HDIG domain